MYALLCSIICNHSDWYTFIMIHLSDKCIINQYFNCIRAYYNMLYSKVTLHQN